MVLWKLTKRSSSYFIKNNNNKYDLPYPLLMKQLKKMKRKSKFVFFYLRFLGHAFIVTLYLAECIIAALGRAVVVAIFETFPILNQQELGSGRLNGHGKHMTQDQHHNHFACHFSFLRLPLGLFLFL